MGSTTPPLGVPSSLVSTMPVMPAAPINSRAWLTPFWPVAASSTSRFSRSQPGSSRSMMREILASSSIRFFLLCSRPAVSQIITSQCRALAAAMASNTTAAGSAPSPCLIIGTSARPAQTSSCSMAAARKVSAAARITDLPWALSMAAILPMAVVLPTPLTPITSTTEGFVPMCSWQSPCKISATMAFSSPIIRPGSVMPFSLMCRRSSPVINSAVSMPTSPITSSSVSSSNSSSSIFVNEFTIRLICPLMLSRVFFRPWRILSNSPI